jgi:MoaA/NifB/PqqE/SkfB family radical SAM enzyme
VKSEMSSGVDRRYELLAEVNQGLRVVRSVRGRRSGRVLGHFLLYLARKSLGRPVPYYLSIELTSRCQLRCGHCCAGSPRSDPRPELSTGEVKSVIRQGREIGSGVVIFNGGEPSLRADLVELVAFATDQGLQTRLNTNALALDRALFLRLKKAGLRQLAVSLDAAEAPVHDGLRGRKGAQAKALEGLRLARAAGVDSLVYTYVSPETDRSGLLRTIDLARRMGAGSLYLTLATAAGRLDRAFDRVLSSREVDSLRRLQDARFVHMEMPSSRSNCNAYRKFVIHVTAQGDATPCPFAPFVLGSVRRVPLSAIWSRFAGGLRFDSRGLCPLNDPRGRRELESYVNRVALALGNGKRDR